MDPESLSRSNCLPCTWKLPAHSGFAPAALRAGNGGGRCGETCVWLANVTACPAVQHPAFSRIRTIPESAPKRSAGCPSHQRTWISCYAAPDRAACAAFFKESRIEFDNATNLDRKSGVPGTMMIGFHCFRRRVQPHLLPRQKQWLGFARLFHPTYAEANVGHPLLLSTHRWWRKCKTRSPQKPVAGCYDEGARKGGRPPYR